MQRAIGYARVSTDEQGSLPAQKAAIRDYAKKYDLDLVDIIIDEGVSGGKKLHKRQGGNKVIQRVENKEVDAVIVYRLDRLSRNSLDCLQVMTDWEEQGVALHFVEHGGKSIDTNNPGDKAMLTIMAAFAEWERGVIRERVVLSLQHKKKRGEKLGGKPTYGYCTEHVDGVARLKSLPAEMDVVEKIKRANAEGRSLREITKALNRDFRELARGRRWHETTVARILKRGKNNG